VNGVPSPIYYASPTQINFQMPWETAVGGARIQVLVNSQPSPIITVPTARVSPGIFNVVHAADYVLVVQRPIQAGDNLVIFGNGLGPVLNQPATGVPAPTGVLATTLELPGVTIGGIPALVNFSGLAPGFIGLNQVNIVVPAGLSSGTSVSLIISSANSPSPGFPMNVK
jgi:uncharacterized protein (TIGR03437 family)